MNKKWLVLACILLAPCALVVLDGQDAKSQADVEVYKLFLGAWQNNKMESTQPYEKVVFKPEGHVDWYPHTYSPKPYPFTYKLRKTWVDASGRVYCQYFYQCRTCRGLGLMRIDKPRKVLEVNEKMGAETEACPEQIEPQAPGANWTLYMVFYRQ
jgi:hypothetical protein